MSFEVPHTFQMKFYRMSKVAREAACYDRQTEKLLNEHTLKCVSPSQNAQCKADNLVQFRIQHSSNSHVKQDSFFLSLIVM